MQTKDMMEGCCKQLVLGLEGLAGKILVSRVECHLAWSGLVLDQWRGSWRYTGREEEKKDSDLVDSYTCMLGGLQEEVVSSESRPRYILTPTIQGSS
jgi:hypothetical protein